MKKKIGLQNQDTCARMDDLNNSPEDGRRRHLYRGMDVMDYHKYFDYMYNLKKEREFLESDCKSDSDAISDGSDNNYNAVSLPVDCK